MDRVECTFCGCRTDCSCLETLGRDVAADWDRTVRNNATVERVWKRYLLSEDLDQVVILKMLIATLSDQLQEAEESIVRITEKIKSK